MLPQRSVYKESSRRGNPFAEMIGRTRDPELEATSIPRSGLVQDLICGVRRYVALLFQRGR